MSFISGQHTYDQHVERKAQQVNWYFSSSQSVIRETSTCQARKKKHMVKSAMEPCHQLLRKVISEENQETK
jgi:hypothetical protein